MQIILVIYIKIKKNFENQKDPQKLEETQNKKPKTSAEILEEIKLKFEMINLCKKY